MCIMCKKLVLVMLFFPSTRMAANLEEEQHTLAVQNPKAAALQYIPAWGLHIMSSQLSVHVALL